MCVPRNTSEPWNARISRKIRRFVHVSEKCVSLRTGSRLRYFAATRDRPRRRERRDSKESRPANPNRSDPRAMAADSLPHCADRDLYYPTEQPWHGRFCTEVIRKFGVHRFPMGSQPPTAWSGSKPRLRVTQLAIPIRAGWIWAENGRRITARKPSLLRLDSARSVARTTKSCRSFLPRFSPDFTSLVRSKPSSAT